MISHFDDSSMESNEAEYTTSDVLLRNSAILAQRSEDRDFQIKTLCFFSKNTGNSGENKRRNRYTKKTSLYEKVLKKNVSNSYPF